MERKWSPDRPRGEKSRKFQYLPELRANKSVQPPSYEYSTIFQNDRQVSPGFLPPKKGPWGRNCAGTEKISAACLPKVTDIPHFIPICHRRVPALIPILCHVCAAYVPHQSPPAQSASALLANNSRLSHRERNFQHRWDNWPGIWFKVLFPKVFLKRGFGRGCREPLTKTPRPSPPRNSESGDQIYHYLELIRSSG